MRSGPPCPAGAARAAAGRPAPSCSSGAFARPTPPPRVIPHRGGGPDAPPSPTPAPPSPPGPSAGAGRAPLWVVARKRRVECSERRQSRGDDALCPFGGEGARRGKRRLGGARAKRADSSRPGGWIAARVEAEGREPAARRRPGAESRVGRPRARPRPSAPRSAPEPTHAPRRANPGRSRPGFRPGCAKGPPGGGGAEQRAGASGRGAPRGRQGRRGLHAARPRSPAGRPSGRFRERPPGRRRPL